MFFGVTDDVTTIPITNYDVIGIPNEEYASGGYASPSILANLLTSESDPNELDIHTRAAIRMNAGIGRATCDTWAVFKVQEV